MCIDCANVDFYHWQLTEEATLANQVQILADIAALTVGAGAWTETEKDDIIAAVAALAKKPELCG